MNTKTLYFMTRAAFIAVFAIALILVPAFNSTGTVSAQREKQEIATPEMIGQALNLKSAAGYTVFAEDGIVDTGNSLIRGNVGVARPTAEIKGVNGGNVKGLIEEANSDSLRVQKDAGDSFAIINQLPCTDVSDKNLGGRTFGPGVYCLSSASLAGEMILDAQGDNSATFIFRIAGSLNTEKGSSVALTNGAQSADVFFVAGDAATIGEDSSFKGNLLTRGSIAVEAGANVEGRAFSVKGDVALNGGILAPQVPGTLEICKAVDTTNGTGLERRVFRFSVPGATNPLTGVATPIVEVPVGQCSGQLSIEAGQVTITELLDGRTLDSGTFNDNFQLIRVRQETNLGQPGTTALVSANLPLRQAVVNIVASTSPAGQTSDQTRITFTNAFAITGVVEICKDALDSGVTGFFNFTIDGLRPGDSTVSGGSTVAGTPNLQVFQVPTGFCSGPITVLVPSNNGAGTATTPAATTPRSGTVTVNELLRTGFICTSATTANGTAGAPNFTNRFINFNIFGSSGVTRTTSGTANAANSGAPNAGTANACNATAFVVEGGTALQTTFFFNNRTAPAQLKICKIAGPGITELTPFNFSVRGTEPLAPVTADTPFNQGTNPLPPNGMTPVNGTLRGTPPPNGTGTGTNPGAVPQGGTITTRNVQVNAGNVNSPICALVPGFFVVDTPATITEVIDSQVQVAGTGVLGDARVSRVTSSTGIVNPTAPSVNPISFNGQFLAQPNVPFFPLASNGTNNGSTTAFTIPIRRGVNEVEFVDIAFSPVALKICKVAGTGVAVGTNFTFTLTADTAGGLMAPFTSTFTVPAGPASSGGFCAFAPGPFSGNFNGTTNGGSINNTSSFNFNSNVTVTEAAMPGVVTSSITSPTGGVAANLTNRSGQITNMINGVNELQFVNSAAPAAIRRKKTLLSTVVTTN